MKLEPDPRRAPGPEEPLRLVDLEGPDRQLAVPAIRDGFVGIYRWHATRKLREVSRVRAAYRGPQLVAVALLDRLLPEVDYVYYITVLSEHRQGGIARRVLDDALEGFRSDGAEVVYAAVQADNFASCRLFERRGFREVAKHETFWQDGGLGAWGLRSRMRLVPGERLLGLRLARSAPAAGSVLG